MTVNEETGMFGLTEGCGVHGDEHMKECSMCGVEFCRLCHPKSTVCPDCADGADEEAEEEAPDFDDVENLEEVLDDDNEAERTVRDGEEEAPPGGFPEDRERF
jgi:hypothetical protein